jgi:hypothetical protein
MDSKGKTKKADKLEQAGDSFAAKGEYKKALKKDRQAAKEDPDRKDLYDKLVDVHEKAKANWKMDDFVESLSWTMKKQEIETPAIKQVHAKLEPEWKKAMDLSLKIIVAPEDENLSKMIEELVGYGEIGTRVLIEMLRSLRKGKEDNPPPL